jgi:hypothetical protein
MYEVACPILGPGLLVADAISSVLVNMVAFCGQGGQVHRHHSCRLVGQPPKFSTDLVVTFKHCILLQGRVTRETGAGRNRGQANLGVPD